MAETGALSGRALDLAVARQVFGFAVEESVTTGPLEPDAVYRLADGQCVRVPAYSSSLTASTQLASHLARLGWKYREERRSKWDAPVPVRVVMRHADGRTVEAVGAQYEALARAAVKAVTP